MYASNTDTFISIGGKNVIIMSRSMDVRTAPRRKLNAVIPERKRLIILTSNIINTLSIRYFTMQLIESQCSNTIRASKAILCAGTRAATACLCERAYEFANTYIHMNLYH